MDTAALRQTWPQVLSAVRDRSKVAWSMISEYAQVLGVEGQVLQLGISNPGLRDTFSGSSREEVLREVLQNVTGLEWKIDVVVDPSAAVANTASKRANGPASAAAAPARPQQQPEPAPSSGAVAGPAVAPPPVQAAPVSAPAPVQAASAQAPAAPAAPFAPAPQDLEEDEPTPDDVDVADAGPTARDLLIRELGASVLEEHENVD
jgi:DNA polymerase-3 subunit gamma/tau